MKKIITLFVLIPGLYTAAQNVGVGTNTPTEKLDVNGNLNVSQTIKANGVAGTSGQVLGANSSGNLAWLNVCEYKNFAGYYTSGTYSWQIPAGVTKVMVELWGAGGGGNLYGGGGGGGYVKAILYNIVPGNFISVYVGSGGLGDTTFPAQNGDSSRIGYGSFNVLGRGGGGGQTGSPGDGGEFSTTASLAEAGIYGAAGQSGAPLREEYYQTINNVKEAVLFGDGGNGGNTMSTGGKGGVSFAVAPSGPYLICKSKKGSQPGGGGGGGNGGGNAFSIGSRGGNGMVIIYY